MFKINNETLEEKELRLKKKREKSKKNKTKIVDKTQEPNLRFTLDHQQVMMLSLLHQEQEHQTLKDDLIYLIYKKMI